MGCCFLATFTIIWAVTIILLYALTFPPIICKFIETKGQEEMRIREPKALIFMIVCFWVGTTLGAMQALQLDYDIDDSEITDHISAWRFLDDLQIICIIAGYTTLFYRSWCMLVKNEIVGCMSSHFYEAAGLSTADDSPSGQIRRTFTKTLASRSFTLRRSVGSRYVAVAMFIFCASLMVILSQVELSIHDRGTVQLSVLILVFLLGSIFESYVIWTVTDGYGTVREFKVFAFVGLFVLLIYIIFDQVTSQFYGLLIRRLFWGITIWSAIIWLYFHIRSYSVDRIQKSTTKGMDFELYDVFKKQKAFENFREYSKVCLCAENVEFIVDIYAVRKTLHVDPWLALSRGESKVIKKFSRVKMKWIDRQIKESFGIVPSMDKIFDLYIKPYAELEVNISGKLQKKLVASFNEKAPPAMKLLSKVELELSSVAYLDSSASLTEEESDHPMSCEVQLESQTEENKRKLVLKKPLPRLDNVITESEGGLDSLQSVRSYNLPKPSLTVKDLQKEHRLTMLYPVWKELIILLHNDTFVRYKESLAQNSNGSSSL